jgi:hypothetical protein
MTTWFRLRPPVRVLVIAVVWFSYAVLVLDLNALDSGSRSAKLIGIACLVGGAITVGVDRSLRPKRRSIEQLMAYRRALRTGELPAPLELEEWRRRLLCSELLNGFAPFAAGPFVFFGLASSLTSPSAYRWVPASAFALLAFWGAVVWWRRHLRIARLQAEIKRRAAATAEEGQAAVTREEAYFRTPRARRVLVIAAMGFTFAFLALLVADFDTVVYSSSRIVHLVWAALFAALMGLVSAIAEFAEPTLRGTSGSIEQLIEYDRALRTGGLPARIEPDVWRAWLKSSHRTLGEWLLWACFFGAVGVLTILTHQSGYHGVTASLFELLAIWMLLAWWGKRAHIAQLAAKVERHAIRQAWG